MDKIKKIQYYECEDGKRFDDWGQARDHQKYLDILNFVAHNLDGDEATLEKITQFIIKNECGLSSIFGWDDY